VTDGFTPRRMLRMFAAVGAVLGVGTVGFRLILDESWLDSFYRTVVTASLNGLDSPPSGAAGRLWTILVVLAGLTIFAYVGAVVVETIAGGLLSGALAEHRRRRTIDRLRDHFIICGFGRVGRRVAREFRAAGVRYVVLDFHDDAVAAAREEGELFIQGNGTEDEDLRKAGLEHAVGLVASADSDADNLYISLSARAARPELIIVARASDEDAERKLKLAGADRVVLPYGTAGRVMANLALKPQVAAFLDVVTSASGEDFHLEEIEITSTCPRAGQSIRDLRVRDETGAIIVAVRKHDGTFDTTPSPDARLEVGDVLISVGTTDELQKLEDYFAPRETVAR
jgi:voltage-gated potassium channel